MRVLFVGASGVIGRSAVRRLVSAGHEVFGTTRSHSKAFTLEALGAESVVLDLLDVDQVERVVQGCRPQVVVNMVTDLGTPPNFRTLDRSFRTTNHLRTVGTEHLVAASQRAMVERYIGQSFAGWFAQPGTEALTTEHAEFLTAPPRAARHTLGALRSLEASVIGAEGVVGTVLRFGPLYGPGTSMASGGAVLRDVQRGRIPVVGGGDGTWSFTHVDDAGAAVAFAVGHPDLHGVFNVVDDDPAPVSTWLPELASILGAPEPKSIPTWMARPVVGTFGVHVMTAVRGADNTALRGRGFVPDHATWREGFKGSVG